MTDTDIRTLEADCDRWRRVAYYLANCHAATATHVGSLKTSSKSERKQQFVAEWRRNRLIKWVNEATDEELMLFLFSEGPPS